MHAAMHIAGHVIGAAHGGMGLSVVRLDLHTVKTAQLNLKYVAGNRGPLETVSGGRPDRHLGNARAEAYVPRPATIKGKADQNTIGVRGPQRALSPSIGVSPRAPLSGHAQPGEKFQMGLEILR